MGEDGGIGVSNSTTGNNFAVEGKPATAEPVPAKRRGVYGAAENNMQPGGTSQELLGVDAVREFNLLTDSYGAEYGKRPGAQVLIVTQSGTNQLHGSLFEFPRNNVLGTPPNYFDPGSAPGFERNQFGGSLGRADPREQDFRVRQLRGLRQHLHQTGVDLVPDDNARNGYLPCKLISPGSALPDLGPRVRGSLAVDRRVAAASPGAPDFGGISEAFNNPLQTIRDDFGTVRLDHVFSFPGHAERGLHGRR